MNLEVEVSGKRMLLNLPANVAAQVGFRMLGASEVTLDDPRAFHEPHILAVSEPAVEVRRSNDGMIDIAFKAREMRPIILQISADRAGEIAASILNLVEEKKR